MTSAPYSWLQKVEEGLSVLKNVPLWGHIPPFPWDAFSGHLKNLLKLTDLQLTVKQNRVLPHQDLLSGMGSHPVILAVEMGTLTEQFFWVVSQEDISKLASWGLCGNHKNESFSNRALQEGFYRYLCLEALDALSPVFNLTFKIIPTPPLPESHALCVDMAMSHNKEMLAGRLICSDTFLKNFKTYFVEKKYSLIEGSKNLEVPLSLEIGHTILPLSDWQSLQVGDVLFFDHLTYDPKSEKAGVTIALGTTPLLLARYKQHKLTILDYAFYQEEETAMDSEEIEEKEGEHLWSGGAAEEQTVGKMIGSKEIPLHIVVEIGRVRMSVDKLLQLQPGNVIELGVRPEQGVTLTVNGTRVARAELVQLGDALGLKILELGH